MMKKFVSFLFFAGLFLLAVALVAPGFVNWNSYKDAIISRVQPHISARINVAGNVGLRILPNPQILLENVSVENFLTLERLEAKIRLKPLLEGRVEIESFNLVKPDVTLEIMADGKPSWTTFFATQKKGKLAQAADMISLEQLMVSDATLRYKNMATGMAWAVESLNLKISADTLFGPYRASGDMKYNGSAVNVDIGTGRYDDSVTPVPVHVALTPMEGLPKISFNGVAYPAKGLDMQGDLFISDGRLSSLLTAPFFQDIYFLNEIVDLAATMEMKNGALTLSGLKARFGKEGTVSGNLVVTLAQGKKPVVKADLSLKNLTIDQRRGFIDVPQFFTGNFNIKGTNIHWHGINFPEMSLDVNTDAMVWDIRAAEIAVPESGSVDLVGTVAPEKLSASLGVQVKMTDTEKALRAFNVIEKPLTKLVPSLLTLSAKVEVVPEKISLQEIVARFGDKMSANGTGTVIFLPNELPVIDTKLKLQEGKISWQGLAAENMQADMVLSCKGLLESSCQGGIDFSADTLHVLGFSPADVAKGMAELKKKPDDIKQLVTGAMQNKEGAVYKKVKTSISISGEKAVLEHVQLVDDLSDTNVSGALDFGSGKYDLSAQVKLKKPEDVPAISLVRTGGLNAAPGYVLALDSFDSWVEKKFPPPPPPKPLIAPESKSVSPIGDILNRLDMEEQSVVVKPDFIGPPAPDAIEEEILPVESGVVPFIDEMPASDNMSAQTP